jgi:hypothetical protein
MTNKIQVSAVVSAVVPGTRTYAMACEENLDVNDYANQVIVQRFVHTHKDDTLYRLAIVELSQPHTGSPVAQVQSGDILQAFDTFSAGFMLSSSIDQTKTYHTYIVTIQGPAAVNPTIKVVSNIS